MQSAHARTSTGCQIPLVWTGIRTLDGEAIGPFRVTGFR